MAKLLTGVVVDTVGTAVLMKQPVTVFADGGLGGGTLVYQVARDTDGTPGPYVTVKSTTDITATTGDGRFNLFVFGVYWLRASISGSTTPSLTVQTG